MRVANGALVSLIGVMMLSSGPRAALAVPAEPPESAPSAPEQADDPFGYARQFREQLTSIGRITPEEFSHRYPLSQALSALTGDPTRARFWDLFQEDPATYGAKATHHPGSSGVLRDFRLNPDELDHLRRNGFVVSERLGARSFGDLFYWIYSRDLPVFISSDALLHAWHRSYDAMLEELEESELAPSLDKILTGMAEALPSVKRQYSSSLRPSLGDADLFLAVGRSLLKGQTVSCVLEPDTRLENILAAVEAMRTETLLLFGRPRDEDFSQYKPRGHYTDSESLGRYFRAMMWCGRTDLRVAGPTKESSSRELGAALILRDLLLRSGRIDDWRKFDSLLQNFVGRTDSMTFDQLGEVLEGAGRRFPQDFADTRTLEDLQAGIVQSGIGRQAIRSHLYESSPFGPDRVELPASFTVIGQRFTPDSWAFSKVVADEILWDQRKVQRRVPTALDVAFAVMGNDQAVPMLVDGMKNQEGTPFRDGLNYQHNLAAVRAVFDARRADSWDDSLYSMWLGCLRELSVPTTDPKYPEVMRTRAWAGKTINTQLASWTQLRHDTILYVKQSATAMAACDYPAGYVEPRPEFWRRFQRMAERASTLMEEISPSLPSNQGSTGRPEGADSTMPRAGAGRIVKNRVEFLRNFAQQLSILAGIAEKELVEQDLNAEEERFLKDIVEISGFSGPPRYTGWYPMLFYKGGADCAKYDALVADVHTDPPSEILGDPGCVLEEGIGGVDLLMGAFECGSDAAVYAGPVLSHYEFESEAGTRLSDPEWQESLAKGGAPSRPDWTRSYLVPGRSPTGR
jgi:hypothetical protein